MSSSNRNEINSSSIPPFISNSPPPPNELELDNKENEYDNDIPKELNLSNELNTTEPEDNEEKNNEDDDDEWADFVDSSLKPPEPESSSTQQQQQQQQQNLMQTNGAFNATVDACKLDNVSSKLETSPPKSDEAPPKTDVLSMFNHQEESSQILSRLFGSSSFLNSKSVPKESSVINISPLDVNGDKTWNQLKEFTFINDASPSLKFKWVLSELETNFLNSINIDNTILKNQNKPYYISFSNGGILQPVKSEETSKAANTDNNNLELSSNHSNKSSNETTTKTTTTSLNSKSTPVLDIDLSYFEDQSKTTNPSTANKPIQKNPRAYINELLDDIYVNNQKAVTNTNKK